jgi:acyl-CoA reductase-like NAD-dependent aldehyde dehydrogenase
MISDEIRPPAPESPPFAWTPPLPGPAPTPVADLDGAVAELRATAPAWPRVAPADRVRLLEATRATVAAVARPWMDLMVRAEGMSPDDPESGEEAVVGPYFLLRALRVLAAAIRDVERRGAPRVAGGFRTRPDGRVVARIFPQDAYDALMYLGTSAEVWLDPDVTLADAAASQAGAYRAPDQGGVCLVLGGGNVSSIGPLDALQKIFVENRVVIMKTHPVNAYLHEVWAAAFSPLIDAGVLRIVHGDAREGAYLAHHDGIDELHITGSDRTYEAIVYGTGFEGAERKRRDEPVLAKRFTAELGNITPIVVVPGDWSAADIRRQADHIASMLVNNGGFNCTAARVIVTHAGWSLRERLLDAVRERLAATRLRVAYYPGAVQRYAAFEAAHPEMEHIGGRDGGADGKLPWGLIPGLSPDATDDLCYTTEAFCSLSAETPIPAATVEEFLAKAAAFCNGTLWGTLNATILVDPATERRHAAAMERLVTELRYGTVAINIWSAVGFALQTTPWGAYPGHRRDDIQSGVGWVHNGLMFDRFEKVVARAPFRPFPKPLWWASHRTAHRLTRHLVRFEATRSPLTLPALFWEALRG